MYFPYKCSLVPAAIWNTAQRQVLGGSLWKAFPIQSTGEIRSMRRCLKCFVGCQAHNNCSVQIVLTTLFTSGLWTQEKGYQGSPWLCQDRAWQPEPIPPPQPGTGQWGHLGSPSPRHWAPPLEGSGGWHGTLGHGKGVESHRNGQGHAGQAGPQCHGSKEFKEFITTVTVGELLMKGGLMFYSSVLFFPTFMC